jgi:hypothetical protein
MQVGRPSAHTVPIVLEAVPLPRGTASSVLRATVELLFSSRQLHLLTSIECHQYFWPGIIHPRGVGVMKARQRIESASFGPESLKVIGEAFDQAWSDIAVNFGNEPQTVENARYELADALLSVATDGSRDVGALKRAALETMALAYRRNIAPPDAAS